MNYKLKKKNWNLTYTTFLLKWIPLNIFFILDNYSGAQMQGGGNRP